MTGVAVAFALAYAIVNAFGAWAVVRHRSAMGAGFFVAAVLLTVGGVGLAYALQGALVLVTLGALAASATSYWHARARLRRVVPWRHLLRAAAGLTTVLAAWAALMSR